MTEYTIKYLFGIDDVRKELPNKNVVFTLADWKTGKFLEDVDAFGNNKQFTDTLSDAIFIENYKNAKDEASKCNCALKKVEVTDDTCKVVPVTNKKVTPRKKYPSDFKSKLQYLYDDNKIVFECNTIDLRDKPKAYAEKVYTLLDRFHAKNVYCVKKDDELFCGIRANTFCIEVGYSEVGNDKIYLITGNHKGIRTQVMLYE